MLHLATFQTPILTQTLVQVDALTCVRLRLGILGSSEVAAVVVPLTAMVMYCRLYPWRSFDDRSRDRTFLVGRRPTEKNRRTCWEFCQNPSTGGFLVDQQPHQDSLSIPIYIYIVHSFYFVPNLKGGGKETKMV